MEDRRTLQPTELLQFSQTELATLWQPNIPLENHNFSWVNSKLWVLPEGNSLEDGWVSSLKPVPPGFNFSRLIYNPFPHMYIHIYSCIPINPMSSMVYISFIIFPNQSYVFPWFIPSNLILFIISSIKSPTFHVFLNGSSWEAMGLSWPRPRQEKRKRK